MGEVFKMKTIKLLCGVMMTGLLLVGCQNTPKEAINILVPTGAPSVLFVDMIEDGSVANVSVVNGVDPIMSEFLNPNQAFDMIVAPIVSVTRLQMEEKTSYKLIGIVSWGNLVIVGPEGLDLNEATLAIFAPMGVPGVISKHLLAKEGLNPQIQAVGTMADAMALYLGGHVDAVLMAYPMAQTLINIHDAYVIMDIQAVYTKHYGIENYPQAGVYVSEKFYSESKNRISGVMNQLTTTHNLNLNTSSRLGNLSEQVKSRLMVDNMDPFIQNYASLGLLPCYSIEKLSELNQFLNLFELELQPFMVVR